MDLYNAISAGRIRNHALSKWLFGSRGPERQQSQIALKVRLLANLSRGPATAAERAVVELLRRSDGALLQPAVAVIAEELYREEINAGAWMVDLGLFSSTWFAPEARRLLKNGNGELWQIY
jgi:hypothetical protein